MNKKVKVGLISGEFTDRLARNLQSAIVLKIRVKVKRRHLGTRLIRSNVHILSCS